MRRREGLLLAGAAAAAPLLSGCTMGPPKTFPALASARAALEAVAANPAAWRCTGAWNLPQVFNHLAQSVEYSLRGFPELKSALFRHTAGAVAFTVFDARGAMSHGLAEPIPGAPALAASDAPEAAIARLLQALRDFEARRGALAPHFAYGSLSKAQYQRAHLMHLANHWDEIVRT